MSELLIIDHHHTKSEKYESLIPQLTALIKDEPNEIANLANIVAALKEAFGFFWIGFYRVEKEELVLGPFQGPIACTRVQYGRGVCGTSWEKMETVIVDDVDEFPGHIVCSSESRSEIVVPVIKKGKVELILDIDSTQLADFDRTDKKHLEEICNLIAKIVIKQEG